MNAPSLDLITPDIRFESTALGYIENFRRRCPLEPVMQRENDDRFTIIIPSRITDATIERPMVMRLIDDLGDLPDVKDVTTWWHNGVYTLHVTLRTSN